MNKNIIKLFAILVMCFMIGSVLVACGEQGEQGEQGVQGEPGATGEQGPQGPSGKSPYPGENGNWFYYDEEAGEYVDSGIRVKGEDLRDCENHHWDKYVVTVQEHSYDPETGKDTIGVVLKTCVDCGDSYFFEIGHEYAKVVTAPTCTEQGYTTYTCDCGHSFVADYTAIVPHTWGDWEEVLNTAGICECEWDQPYIRHCTVCGIEDEETKTTPAPGHVYTNYKPALRDDNLDISDCNWVPQEVAQCDTCGHRDCYDMRPAGDGKAPGHKWGEWYIVTAPTADAEGEIARECSVCATTHPAEGVETEKVGKLSETDYTYAVTKAPNCTETGTGVYTHKVYTAIKVEVVIDALGHDYENAEYKVTKLPGYPTSEEDMANCTGTVEVSCNDCDYKHVVELPALTKQYGHCMTSIGNCLLPDDTYSMPIDVEGQLVQVEFTVKGNYVHDEMPAASELKKVDGEDKWYYVYWCTKCEHWIIADWEPKTNA